MYDIAIHNTNGELTVSSLQVSEDFEKRHDHVVRDIENLITMIDGGLPKNGETGNSAEKSHSPILGSETSAKNFANLTAENSAVKKFFIESTYINERGKEYKCYEITRDGFSLLAMGFTGKKALEWKLNYIEAFNKMLQYCQSDNSALLQYVQSLENRIERLENGKLLSLPKSASRKRNAAQNRQLNGEAEIIDVIADIMAGDFEMEDITVTEFVQQNCILAKYSLLAIAKVLNKLGYKQTMKRRKGSRSVIRTRNLPVSCNTINK